MQSARTHAAVANARAVIDVSLFPFVKVLGVTRINARGIRKRKNK